MFGFACTCACTPAPACSDFSACASQNFSRFISCGPFSLFSFRCVASRRIFGCQRRCRFWTITFMHMPTNVITKSVFSEKKATRRRNQKKNSHEFSYDLQIFALWLLSSLRTLFYSVFFACRTRSICATLHVFSLSYTHSRQVGKIIAVVECERRICRLMLKSHSRRSCYRFTCTR